MSTSAAGRRTRRVVRLVAGAVVLASAGCRGGGAASPSTPPPEVIDTPAEVLQEVARAHREAPATATFFQANTVTLTSGNIVQRQRVIVSAPGRMRVDNLPLSGRSAAIYVGNRAIGFANGRRASATGQVNPFLLTGFALFRQPAAASRADLDALGIATARMHRAEFGGAPVWVIGAEPGDTTSNQIWIDAARWVPLRLIQSERRGGQTMVSDTRYSGHAEPAPTIPRVIEIYRNGRLALRGEVQALRTGIPIPEAAFDTTTLRPVEP